MPITKADLTAWRDDTATLHDIPPSDPAEHYCMFHGRDSSRPVTVDITTKQHLVRYACRPCGEAILAVLHGTPVTDVPRPEAAVEAAELSIWMARILGEDEASVTEPRPRNEGE